MKLCSINGGCNTLLPLKDFRFKKTRSAHSNVCINCERRNKTEHRKRLSKLPESEKVTYLVAQSTRLRSKHSVDIPGNIKQCGRCKIVKSISGFSVAAMNPDHLQTNCTSCVGGMYVDRQKFETPSEGSKVCQGECGELKDLTSFAINKIDPSGRKNICFICNTRIKPLPADQLAALTRASNLLRTQYGLDSSVHVKKCPDCPCPKSIENFNINRLSKDGYVARCKQHLSTVAPVTITQFKLKANYAVNFAIKTGKLVKPDACSGCMKTGGGIQGHHHDYMDVLNITWLCRACHNAWHNNHTFNMHVFNRNQTDEDLLKIIKVALPGYVSHFEIPCSDRRLCFTVNTRKVSKPDGND